MPNLKQTLKLKTKYNQGQSDLSLKKLNILLEAFDPDKIEKGFDSSKIETKTFSYTTAFVKRYEDFFKERKKVKAVLLFIDVTSFATKFLKKNAEQIAEYLDEYYDKVIPVISKHGGEVEKIIGDGIICVFGEPFLSLDEISLHRKAEKCATELIKMLKDTDYALKIAFHYGEIMYYQNECSDYWEYTMIGNALTELFRLENVSHPNSINFFCKTVYEELNEIDVAAKSSGQPAGWLLSSPETVDLSGVSYTHIRYLKKV
jgi:class 3 adenylate cyclase